MHDALQVKACIQALKGYTESPTDGLLNAIRYSKHINDPETPNNVKALLQN
jgi:hypothetical protein